MRKLLPIVLLASVGSFGCTKDQMLTRAATGLDVVQSSTDVAWSFAVEASLREQTEYVAGLERIKEAAGPEALPPEAEVRAHLTEIRARWLPRFIAFRGIRLAHSAALSAFEAYAAGDGSLASLIAKLAELAEMYGELQKLLGDIPGLDFELPTVEL